MVSNSVTNVRGEIHYCESDYSTEGNLKILVCVYFSLFFSCANETLPVEHFLVMYTKNFLVIYTSILFRI